MRYHLFKCRVGEVGLLRLKDLDSNWKWSNCAVIAREWKYLEPARAYCEAHGIPVQMANEEIPRFWLLRETRGLIGWLRERESRLVDETTLRAWLDLRPGGPWTDLLREAIDEHALETAGTEVPVEHAIEWLAEWGRDVRRRQRGLLLATAHRAKGLEFDHVAVLDGGWEKRSTGREDADAPRRLYYVAMTRARETLALVRFDDRAAAGGASFVAEPEAPAYAGRVHPLPNALPGGGPFQRGSSTVLPPESPSLARQYRVPRLDEINLGFSGRLNPRHRVHGAIAALSPGDPLQARLDGSGRWTLLDGTGTTVGRLAKGFVPPPGTRCVSATVHAVVAWSRDVSKPEYREALRCDAWEVVVPELIFERDAPSSRGA